MAGAENPLVRHSEKAIAIRHVALFAGVTEQDVHVALREDWTSKGTPFVRRKMKAILKVAELLGLSGKVRECDIFVSPRPNWKTNGRDDDKVSLKDQLHTLLGDEGYLCLVENYGGTRLYVPQFVERSKLIDAIPGELAEKLSSVFGRDCIRVPIDRDFLARTYIERGMSIRQVAVCLRVTESTVDKFIVRSRKTNRPIVRPDKD